VGRLHRDTRSEVANMLVGAFEKDSGEVAATFEAMGMAPADRRKFELDIEDLVSRYYGVPLGELKIGDFLSDLLNLVTANRVNVNPDLFVLAKSIITIESVGRDLDPGFDMAVEVRPFIEKLIRERYDPRNMAKEAKKFASSGMRLAANLPSDISEIITKLKKGTTRIEFEHQGLENFILHMDKVSNRISFSLVITALVVGSALIMMTDKGPMLIEFPILGIVGFIAAGIMGLWLVVAILRSGKL
jgi:ubiquinone biosynthesis protein